MSDLSTKHIHKEHAASNTSCRPMKYLISTSYTLHLTVFIITDDIGFYTRDPHKVVPAIRQGYKAIKEAY